jgi:uncharacterized protein YebE (UPF0316 family)
MSTGNFRTSAEGFAVASAVIGVMLAALLAQTKVLAFGSFRMMAAVLVAVDLVVYIVMKMKILKSPNEWGQQKS